MMSLRLFTGAAAAAALTFALPAAAHAAPVVVPDDCAKAQAIAEMAERDYEDMVKWYQDLITQGGHPGVVGEQAVADAKADLDRAAAEAQRICGP
ncbi:hypothetical protein SSP24_64400 [Streptomyces spinoverrucosus]|uniref:Haemophore haem-binding domain-containing protein n=1 Tax=Streptomyces spinoverrucosus TaxID=284043 RepID=A0A4Y3VRY0_9ACTN|nr:hypothetical protein [Streptomyces spinoverrucosus]GEC08785.1 hypothetical protein SSP24_64400 [Streptomyces spinoverrucosus]GHB88908.1 hypothetical protein GCM10010397_71090 [Streptomyces spinoverrucosus]